MPTTSLLSALCVSVGYIIGVTSKEQMVWINARRIVAAMQDTHPVVNGAVAQFVGNTVSGSQLSSDEYLAVSAASF